MGSAFGKLIHTLLEKANTEKMRETIILLRKREYRKLWGSEFISEIGNYFSFFGIIFYVIKLTEEGGTLEAAQTLTVIVIFQVVPTLIIGPFIGVLVDKINRKIILLSANIMGAFVAYGYSQSTTISQIYALVIVHSFVRLVFYPTRTAILPRLVEKEELLHANSMIQISVQFSRLIGPLLAGIVLSQFGFRTGFLIDGVSYIIAAIIVVMISTNLSPKGGEIKTSPLHDMNFALKEINKSSQLRFLFTSSFILLVGVGILDPLLAPYLNSAFGFSPREFGGLLAFSAVSGAFSTVLLIAKGKFSNKLKLIAYGYILGGIAMILLGEASQYNNILLLYIAAGFLGIVNVGVYILTATFIQETVKDEHLGKINGMFATNLVLGQLVGSFVASLLIRHLAYEEIFMMVGLIITISGSLSVYSISKYDLDQTEQEFPYIALGFGK